jgi:outer membrane protein OmpA-like peptidoglycan-associated protein
LAKYLTDHPEVKCWVVGHTSSEGSFDINSSLSLKRALAIKSSLEKNHNIAAGRLFAEGVGPLAPLASNTTEEGKKMNRRVELVLK